MARARQLHLGDPLAAGTDISPKVSSAELEKVERMIAAAEQDGAQIVLGGSRPPVGQTVYMSYGPGCE